MVARQGQVDGRARGLAQCRACAGVGVANTKVSMSSNSSWTRIKSGGTVPRNPLWNGSNWPGKCATALLPQRMVSFTCILECGRSVFTFDTLPFSDNSPYFESSCLSTVLSDLLNYDKIENGQLKLELTLAPIFLLIERALNEIRLSAKKKNLDLHLWFSGFYEESRDLEVFFGHCDCLVTFS